MNISVKLLHYTPIEVLIGAIRQCYDSHSLSDSKYYVSKDLKSYNETIFEIGDKDCKLIQQIISNQHHSCLEHIVYNFQIKGISRLVLQELARHRIASLSVKSTRYTLKELKYETEFITDIGCHWERAEKYINLTGNEQIDTIAVNALDGLRMLICAGYSNDEAKYVLPESFKTDLYWTINARSLRNFIQLRTSPRAHQEIRLLAETVRNNIPLSHKLLFDDL